MSLQRNIGIALGGVGAAAAAAIATGVTAERRVVRTRRGAMAASDRLGTLHSDPVTVVCDDGLRLVAEVDEVSPYAGKPKKHDHGPTLVFVHGYALSLDCWHYQREAFRGKYRMAFYDQRSHGRSERSSREHATIEQLGDDLARVLEQVVPKGDVVLIGHSMGGMTLMTFADQHPELFASRVRGVALISTTAGGLRPYRTVAGRLLPDRVGVMMAPRVVAALARAPELVDSARKSGSNIGYLVAGMFAFGTEAPPEQIDFLDRMLAVTPFEVLAEFFPAFSKLDRFAGLAAFGRVPTTIICGTKDKLTSIGHSRKMAGLIPHARLVECQGAGHMVIFEKRDRVNAALEALIAAAHR